MKVNDYIRTDSGNIGKIENINDFRPPECKIAVDFGWKNLIFFSEKNIKKHNKKIQNLIEVGDIVEVSDGLFEEHDYYFVFSKDMLKALKEDIKDGRIKMLSILTKEQIEKNTSKVV